MGFGVRSVNPGDVLPPTVPGTVSSSVTGDDAITVTWTASADASGVAAYRVELSSSIHYMATHPTTSHTFTGLVKDVDYTPRVRAYDTYGNYSELRYGVPVRIPSSSGFDMDADWETRRSAPGVFYANNCTDEHRGCPGFWTVGGRDGVGSFFGRQEDFNKFQQDSDLISGEGLIAWPDGRGSAMRATSGGLSGGAFRLQRRGYRWAMKGPDWNVHPYSYMPKDYTGGDNSVPGMPGYRYRINEGTEKFPDGTTGTFQTGPCKYVETYRNPALGTASHNSGNLPTPREFYLQVAIWVPEEFLWARHRHWISQRDKNVYGCDNVTQGYHTNKWIFIDAYTPGQVAVNTPDKTGAITMLMYNGESTNSLSIQRKHAGGTTGFSCNEIDNLTPATTDSSPLEDMLQRYGVSSDPIAKGFGITGMLPLPGDITERFQSLTKTEADELGISLPEGNLWSASWRGYPFGGFSSTAKTIFPELNLQADGTWNGVVNPGRWHVITVYWSAQVEAPLNDNMSRVSSSTNPGFPMFNAIWAAPYGEPPRLLGYTRYPLNDGKSGSTGASFRPSRLQDDNNPSFQYQDAQTESYKDMGAIIVGPAQNSNCMMPTLTQFDAVRDRRARQAPGESSSGFATSLRYRVGSATSGGSTDWGTRKGMFDGSTGGFSSGVLASTTYDPVGIPNANKVRYGQYEVVQTMPLKDGNGAQVYAPDSLGQLMPVHRVTLSEMHLVPAVGDGFIFHNVNNKYEGKEFDIPGVRETRMGYTEVIFSVDEIRFPGHPNTPLPKPWKD